MAQATTRPYVRDDERGRVYDAATGEIMDGSPPEPQPFRMLDKYQDTGSAPMEDRVDWLGTISAGYKTEKGYPAASRDGSIYLSDPEGRSAKLRELLQAEPLGEWAKTTYKSPAAKKITISVMSNSIDEAFYQHYVLYSQSSLVAHGDMFQMVAFEEQKDGNGNVIVDKDNKPILKRNVYTYDNDREQYDYWRARCVPSWSLFFVVAAWEGSQSSISFPDEFGRYRLRSGSRNSFAAALGKLKEVGKLTEGQIAGIPLELSIGYRDVAGPDGRRRNIPVWNFALKPPKMIQLTSGNFRGIIGAALEEGRKLYLELPSPSPTSESWERGELADSGAVIEPATAPAEADVARVQTPDVKCDPLHYEAAFFASVRGSYLDSDAARAQFVAEMSGTATTSLAEFLAGATIAEADRLILTVNERVLAARELAMKAGLADKSRIDTSGVPPQAAAADGSLVPPPPTPIDAPVIELGGASGASGASGADVSNTANIANTANATDVADHPPTGADAVAPPPAPPAPPETPDKPAGQNPLRQAADEASAARKDLEAEWATQHTRARREGLKDNRVISSLKDDELRAAIDELKGRIRDKQRADGTLDERDLAGDQPPTEGPSLPLGI